MNTIYPIHYDLFLDINIADFTFQGKNVMTVVMKNKTSKVTIDSFKLEIYKCKININGTWKEIQYELDMEKQKLHLNFIEELDGEYQIKIKYKGEINKSMIGFYRSEFKHNGEEKFAAVTQFQENYARMAFPCFDEPKYKAAFDISYRIEKQYFAISNMPIIEEIEEEDKKIVKFDRTPIMSTYLVFFGVGDFEFIEDEVNGTILRLVASPGKASENGEFGLSFGKKTLQYCEDYYGIDYPLPKLDMIGTPAFGHGAMENWGAMLFREDLLLHFGEITSILKEM
ncbi:MAG: M1 family metallopeptidase, partial [Candidatus Heimdallarchaeota archaeon]|nr:M1 family metallopeptidase [Candidatus Heimdallarchaeota archaeon]